MIYELAGAHRTFEFIGIRNIFLFVPFIKEGKDSYGCHDYFTHGEIMTSMWDKYP